MEGIFCKGAVTYYQRDVSPDTYQAVWDCAVGESAYACKRNSHYEESPLGDPNESYNYDSGGWHEPDPVTGGPKACLPPKDQIDEDAPAIDTAACDRAKLKVKKAKKKVRKADTPFEKTKAKNKLKKAKKRKKEACVTPARPVTD